MSSLLSENNIQLHRYFIKSKRVFLWLFDLENCSEISMKILLREIQIENIIVSLQFNMFLSNEFEQTKQKLTNLVSFEEFEGSRIFMVIHKQNINGKEYMYFYLLCLIYFEFRQLIWGLTGFY